MALFVLTAFTLLAVALASGQRTTTYRAPLEADLIALEYVASGGLGTDSTIFRLFGDGRLTKQSGSDGALLAEKILSAEQSDFFITTINAGRLMHWDPERLGTELRAQLGYNPVMVDAGRVTLRLKLEDQNGVLEERELTHSYAPWQIKKLYPALSIPEIEALAEIEKQLDDLTQT